MCLFIVWLLLIRLIGSYSAFVVGACSEWEWVLVRILRVLLHALFHHKYNPNFYKHVKQMEYDNNEH